MLLQVTVQSPPMTSQSIDSGIGSEVGVSNKDDQPPESLSGTLLEQSSAFNATNAVSLSAFSPTELRS
jgi:hypothetical protein